MYYRQPRYFSDFHCIGGECPDNCCHGWRVDWSKEEVEKVKTAPNISAELKKIVEETFVPNEEIIGKYRVKYDEHNKCPCLTENGLCRIQRELGAEFLSHTCMVYPRRYFVQGSTAYCFCDASCRAVMESLFNNEKSMDLINRPIRENSQVATADYSDKEEHPELQFHSELFEFFYEIISDKKHDVETNIILGALAAQSLTKLVAQGEADRIPGTLKQLKAQMHNGAQLKAIENIKPNYSFCLGLVGKMLKEIVALTMIHSLFDNTGTLNIDIYNTAKENLQKNFADRPFFLRNIALNLLFELAVPFKYTEKTIFENFTLFVAAFACIKLNIISLVVSGKEGKVIVNVGGKNINYINDDRFIGMTSLICRPLCHNQTVQKAILSILKEYNCTTPAYLALLVK